MMDEKVVVVFGAYGSVGREIAKYNAEEGAKVFMVGRDAEKLEAVAHHTPFTPENSASIIGDANDPDDVIRAITTALRLFGKIDQIWITVGKDGGWERNYPDTNLKELEESRKRLRPSLLGPVMTVSQIAKEVFKDQGFGILVHLSSHVVEKGEDVLPGNWIYRELKEKAEKVVVALRNTLKAIKGNKATAINLRPAIINTEGNAKLLDTEEKRRAAVQPRDMAKWVNEYAEDPDLPENQYFHSTFVVE